MTLLRIAIVAVSIASLCPTAEAFCRLTTVRDGARDSANCIRDGIPLAWDRRCFTYTLHIDGARDIPFMDVQRIIAESFTPWTQVTCGGTPLNFEFSETEQTTTYPFPYYNQEAGNQNSIVFVEDWRGRDHDPLAFAVTTVWHDRSNGRIVDGDMEINESRSRQMLGTCPRNNECPVDTGCAVVDLGNVVTHEAGHFLGMAHSDVPGSTMFDSAPIGESCKNTLEADDEAGLCAAYPSGSLPLQCNPAPNGGFDFSGPKTPSSCGCAARTPVNTGMAAVALTAFLFARKRKRR